MTTPRLLLDISTLLRHWERADGITRTLSKLAGYALVHLPHIEFVYLGDKMPVQVKQEYVRPLLAGKIRIDISHFPDPAAKPRLRDRLPPLLKGALLWIQRPRRQALVWADALAARAPSVAPFTQWLRPRLLDNRYRRSLTGPNGEAVRLVRHRDAFCAMSPLAGDDVLILAGSDWLLMSQKLARLDPRPKTAALCYDIIPLLFPEFFSPSNVTAFRGCVENVFAHADLVIFSAAQIGRDTTTYWQNHGRPVPPITVVPLGADVPARAESATALPSPLVAGKFALFVSTIEPRKGHRLLFEAWKALLDQNVPQQFDFKLAFVGRKGWMVDELWREITAHPSFGTSLIVMSDIDDATLDTLYDACAFTLYPSLYEGFGLPIVESYRHGKAVIASAAGALPETVAGFSPCLSPNDDAAWRDLLKQWIANPSAYRDLEQSIRTSYVPIGWDAAAAHFFSAIVDHLVPAAPIPARPQMFTSQT